MVFYFDGGSVYYVCIFNDSIRMHEYYVSRNARNAETQIPEIITYIQNVMQILFD